MHRKKKIIVSVWILSGILGLLPGTKIHAEGNINGNESAVLGALSGEFTYDGSVYVVEPSYLEALRSYFAEDGVDLTEGQKDKCISGITGNIGQAVSEGYLIKVRDVSVNENDTKEEGNQNSSDQKEDNKKKSEEDTESNKKDKKTKKNKKTEKDNEKDKATEEPGQLTEEEEARLKEKWKTEIAAIEEDAEKIRNGGSLEEEAPNATAATEKTIDQNESNLADNNRNTGFQQIIIMVALGLGAMAAIFYVVFRIWRKRPVLTEHNYTDIHSHILPGVDDGAKDMEETLAMLRKAKEEGIQTIIATPHYKVGQRKKTVTELKQVQAQVQQEIEKEGLDMKILLGNELYYNREICERLDKGQALTLADTRYVLVEFSFFCEYTEMYQGLRDLIQGGYIPILAHMERYACLHKDKSRDKIEELIRMGVYMQMNAESLNKNANRKLVKAGYIHFLGSDSHNMGSRKPNMQTGIKNLGMVVTKEQMEQILFENPGKLRADKYLS